MSNKLQSIIVYTPQNANKLTLIEQVYLKGHAPRIHIQLLEGHEC
jgi:hypothetical protein